jgi:hypothetical protein
MPIPKQSELQTQRQKVEQYGQQATAMTGAGTDFMNRVRQELSQRAATRGIGQLAEQAGAARKEYVEAPVRIREQYAGAEPTARMAAETRARAGVMEQLSNITAAQQAQGQTVEDVLGTVKGGIEAETARVGQGYEVAQQIYSNLLDEADLEERQRQFNIDTELRREQMAMDYAIAQLRDSTGSATAVTEDDLAYLSSFAQSYDKAKKRLSAAEEEAKNIPAPEKWTPPTGITGFFSNLMGLGGRTPTDILGEKTLAQGTTPQEIRAGRMTESLTQPQEVYRQALIERPKLESRLEGIVQAYEKGVGPTEDLSQALMDAENEYNNGVDLAAVKGRFLQKFPTKGSTFDTYFQDYVLMTGQ